MKKERRVIVPDTSAIIEGSISRLLNGKIDGEVEVDIPLAVMDELQAQASKSRESGWIGLEELSKVREICEKKGFTLRFIGERPSLEDIRLANSGRIDSLIIESAKSQQGILYTADIIQGKIAEIRGVKVNQIRRKRRKRELSIIKFFSPDTLSVHLKEDVPPLAKKGVPGKLELTKIREEPCTAAELERIIKEVYDTAQSEREGFIEVSASGAMVIQLGIYRIAIARPPFSDGLELTVVRPIVDLTLEDYRLSEKLIVRFKEGAEGILIAGPPGSGKTTFASSLAAFYSKQGKIVKTMESPRDLQVGPEITQYSPLEGSFEKTADILLLVRPDYSIFDEIRKSDDFTIFSDMRSAGVGMIGVVHANAAVEAVQRFMSRIELGLIPQTIDTIIFVKYGRVEEVFTVTLTVKVPTGMVESELARPVVELRDFETNQLKYEIYTFGDENIIMPISHEEKKGAPVNRLAGQVILQEVKRFDPYAQVDIIAPYKAVLRVEKGSIPELVGRKGARITMLEKRWGISLDVVAREDREVGDGIPFDLKEYKSKFEITLGREYAGKRVNLVIEDEEPLTITLGKKGIAKIPLKSDEGRILGRALQKRRKVVFTL